MISFRLSAAALALMLAPAAAAGAVHGSVFDDRNGNGTRDAGEPGLPQVGVSDGTAVVLTDAGGRFELPSAHAAPVFVIKPRGWRPPVDAQNLPQFYHRDAPGLASVDFPLVRGDEPDAFRAL